MERYVIALDAMGGDYAPNAAVGGAVLALRRFEDISILLAGPKDKPWSTEPKFCLLSLLQRRLSFFEVFCKK